MMQLAKIYQNINNEVIFHQSCSRGGIINNETDRIFNMFNEMMDKYTFYSQLSLALHSSAKRSLYDPSSKP